MTDPFAAYHRAGRRMTLARVIPAVAAALAVAAVVLTATVHTGPEAAPPSIAAGASSGAPSSSDSLFGTAPNGTAPNGTAQDGAAPNGTAQDGAALNGASLNGTASNAAAPNRAVVADGGAGSSAVVLPRPSAGSGTPTGVAPIGSPLPITGTPQWSIAIDTTGFQAEIDACLWVRMELGTHAPIVGAHNYCGGDVVLGMALGDSVVLAGVGLDGTYVVTAARDAHAGDNARTATEGLGGSVILQTCYWGGGGTERLVALTPA